MFGFYKVQEHGYYSGYNYDYLLNVMQHTNWDCEFIMIDEGSVSASLKKAEEMLYDGEIDLLGPFSATSTRFDDFEVTSRNYGVYRYNFYSARNNYAITQDNFFLQDTLRVALVEHYTDLNEKFLHVMEDVLIDIDISYVQSHAETLDLLLSEEVDCIINLDMSSNAEYLDYLSTIERIPFHFASTKGNTELIAELDDAIRKIEIIEPDIHQILLEKYFGTRYDTDFLFMDEELSQLESLDSFKVGLLANVPPYQSINEYGENVGITVDILNIFEEILGIPFEIVWVETHDLLLDAILAEEIDLIGTLPSDYPLAQSLAVTLTNSYISSSAYWMKSRNEVENPEILFHFVSSIIPFYAKEEMNTTVNIERALHNMEKQGTVSVFCDPYIADYFLILNQHENIEVHTVTDVLSEISFGVGGHIDENLIGMLNRAILYLDSYEIDEIIYNNTSITPKYGFWDFITDNALIINAIFLFFGVCILISVYSTSKKFRELSRRDSLTKLYNAGYFHEYAEEKIPHLTSGAFILVDIDYFKNVNDTYGHHSGDDIIKLVAINMTKIGNNAHFYGRVGGDEFAILVEKETSKEELELQTRAFLDAMLSNETGIPTTLSIGGFLITEPTQYNDLYKNADKVLYQVKEQGRNGFLYSWCFFWCFLILRYPFNSCGPY